VRLDLMKCSFGHRFLKNGKNLIYGRNARTGFGSFGDALMPTLRSQGDPDTYVVVAFCC
jgi:hypothetical protein